MCRKNKKTLALLCVVFASSVFSLYYMCERVDVVSLDHINANATFAGTYADFAFRANEAITTSPNEVNVLVFDSIAIDANTMAEVCALPRLRFLQFRNCEISFGAAARLGELRDVRVLVFDGSNITDADLKAVAKNLNLDCVSVADTDVSELSVSECLNDSSIQLVAIGDLDVDVIREQLKPIDRHIGFVETLSRYMVPPSHIW